MKLSRTVWYAVQAVLQLAEADRSLPISCKRLSGEGKMPERFLLQILRNLAVHGILASTRGVDGGYRLDREPEEISLLEVIEAIDGPFTTELRSSAGLSGRARARLERTLHEVNEAARRRLDSLKLSDLLPSGALA
jgi:Rrf2 family protein